MWIVLMTFSFWSISFIVRALDQSDLFPYMLILAVYGSCLVLLAMGAFFYFFTTSHLSPTLFVSGLLFVAGALVFLASDNFLAHGKFNKLYPFFSGEGSSSPEKESMSSYLIMITYYVAQYLLAKGAFFFTV